MKVVSPGMFPEKFETVLRRTKARFCGWMVVAIPIFWMVFRSIGLESWDINTSPWSTIFIASEIIFAVLALVCLRFEQPKEVTIKKRPPHSGEIFYN